MKKIVFNASFGGFRLSPLALRKYAKLKGIDLTFYEQTKYSFKDEVDEYTRIDNIEQHGSYHVYPVTKDLGEYVERIPGEFIYYPYPDIKRDDLDLVSVVEEFGELANGDYADLQITEVNDKWTIDEYDGFESVMTPRDYEELDYSEI